MNNFWSQVLAAITIGMFIGTVWANWERDDTDPPVGEGLRSGMSLHIDHRTGCHYLGRAFTSLIPRLDKDGNHVCD